MLIHVVLRFKRFRIPFARSISAWDRLMVAVEKHLCTFMSLVRIIHIRDVRNNVRRIMFSNYVTAWMLTCQVCNRSRLIQHLYSNIQLIFQNETA